MGAASGVLSPAMVTLLLDALVTQERRLPAPAAHPWKSRTPSASASRGAYYEAGRGVSPACDVDPCANLARSERPGAWRTLCTLPSSSRSSDDCRVPTVPDRIRASRRLSARRARCPVCMDRSGQLGAATLERTRGARRPPARRRADACSSSQAGVCRRSSHTPARRPSRKCRLRSCPRGFGSPTPGWPRGAGVRVPLARSLRSPCTCAALRASGIAVPRR